MGVTVQGAEVFMLAPARAIAGFFGFTPARLTLIIDQPPSTPNQRRLLAPVLKM